MNLSTELSRPWAMHESGVRVVEAAANGRGLFGERFVSSATIENGVATIPIEGVLVRDTSDFMKKFGFVACVDIVQSIREHAAHPGVSKIVLAFDSPGGAVSGIMETVAAIEEAGKSKPIESFTSGMMASAAYWLASATSRITASPSAVVGSIGVLTIHEDLSGLYSAAGIRLEVFRSGALKAAGVHGTALTEDQREDTQAQINETFGLFKAQVKKARARVSEEVWKGGTFLGEKARAAGLVDAIVSSMSLPLPAHSSPPIFSQSTKNGVIAADDYEGQWRASEQLRGEFGGNFEAYVAYQKATQSGKLRHFQAKASPPTAASHPVQSTAPYEDESDWRAQWKSSPALRNEFGSAETFIADKRAETGGKVKVYGGTRS